MKREGISKKSVAGIFSIDLKADEPAVHEVAKTLGVSARFYDASKLSQETDRLSVKSEIVFKETGCYGVAEAAALLPTGSRGKLILPKEKTKRSTCAMAESVASMANTEPAHISVLNLDIKSPLIVLLNFPRLDSSNSCPKPT